MLQSEVQWSCRLAYWLLNPDTGFIPAAQDKVQNVWQATVTYCGTELSITSPAFGLISPHIWRARDVSQHISQSRIPICVAALWTDLSWSVVLPGRRSSSVAAGRRWHRRTPLHGRSENAASTKCSAPSAQGLPSQIRLRTCASLLAGDPLHSFITFSDRAFELMLRLYSGYSASAGL